MIVCLIAMCGLAWAAFAGPFFEIRYIEASVPERCEEKVAKAVPLGANLLLFDAKTASAAVETDSLVESVTIDKILPNTVRVDAKLRRGELRIAMGERQWYEVDATGVVLRPAVGEELPLLSGADPPERPGESVDPGAVQTALVWLSALPRYNLPTVTKVDYLGAGTCNLALEDGRLVKVGDATEVDRKLAAAEAMLAYRPNECLYVDVAVTSQPVAGMRIPEVEADAESQTGDEADTAQSPAMVADAGDLETTDGQLIDNAGL